jgi:hypothetical protein
MTDGMGQSFRSSGLLFLNCLILEDGTDNFPETSMTTNQGRAKSQKSEHLHGFDFPLIMIE